MSALDSPGNALQRDMAESLNLLADSHDRYSLMGAIQRCDDLVSAIRATQLIHSQNLCRLANRLAAGMES